MFGLRLGGGRERGVARQGAKISETDAQILEIGPRSVLLKKTSRDAIGTQSGTNFAFLGTTFGQSGSSRDPVGHQFSSFWHRVWTCREAAKITQKRAKTFKKCCFMNLAAS